MEGQLNKSSFSSVDNMTAPSLLVDPNDVDWDSTAELYTEVSPKKKEQPREKGRKVSRGDKQGSATELASTITAGPKLDLDLREDSDVSVVPKDINGATALLFLLKFMRVPQYDVLASGIAGLSPNNRRELVAFLGGLKSGDMGEPEDDDNFEGFSNAFSALMQVSSATKTQILSLTTASQFCYTMIGSAMGYRCVDGVPHLYITNNDKEVLFCKVPCPDNYIFLEDGIASINAVLRRHGNNSIVHQPHDLAAVRMARACLCLFDVSFDSNGKASVGPGIISIGVLTPGFHEFVIPEPLRRGHEFIHAQLKDKVAGKTFIGALSDPVGILARVIPVYAEWINCGTLMEKTRYWKCVFDTEMFKNQMRIHEPTAAARAMSTKHKEIRKKMGNARLPEFDYIFSCVNYLPRSKRARAVAELYGADDWVDWQEEVGSSKVFPCYNWVNLENVNVLPTHFQNLLRSIKNDKAIIRLNLLDRNKKEVYTRYIDAFKTCGWTKMRCLGHEQKHSLIIYLRVGKVDGADISEVKLAGIMIGQARRVMKGELEYMRNCMTGTFGDSNNDVEYTPKQELKKGLDKRVAVDDQDIEWGNDDDDEMED